MSSTAVTPLPKSSAPDTPVFKEAPSTPQPVAFPPPQTFDIIPPLHGLILRLLSTPTNAAGVANGTTTGDDGSGVAPPSSGAPAVPSSGSGAASAAAAAEIAALGSNLPPPLDIKNLPTEVSSIKIRIQKAHAVVENLPDIHRTVAEQESEIHELEDRIGRLKAVISDFGKRANNTRSQKTNTYGP
ncbi:hypothetical protein P175DRAFT_0486971 [Aspergillus ochraceoroseus IBT 24754]|uniref:Mediator of RNA polymerase II transcription subunit 9 n=1 Tax=Aspergillus ochraceoroseus IBT 24754 TaxID=1392256 RepID=A0A2T5LME3_9EURO|nr:uncharacterized protein P175DRAFT_0486971 [Aspergillus ochraceoroseus IBT 24754]PTU17458.1 hypothetical protein P175DRAFT_0486971 [Aspergillus ochraceoroseus IBT 24754]